ncbi:PAS domain-containing serine/threonine-protein kinase-like [Hemibagrus wyckioides]|uniref:PAS domain-containing serine/threonine-protein kinase-like n=1 Tax=Hemibagrus wyckioides TaxID=337641 RepID=UPI00266B3B96|nr:PAS domain-containing serine/threonine-protein kinase-like [Hemibagrus wyckioides]XP_058240330.1 PAS domain-containing serine/threonine-protein kinase-like [Hemibagrus wyckioides]
MQQANKEPLFPAPLMSKYMQKEKLFQFIQWKIQKSLKCIKVEDYVFWQIMELFCRKNGKVMMCEVAAILLKGYGLLRRKLDKVKDAQRWKEWCLPLARLLFSAAPDDEHREAVIKMGDDLASRKLIYPAHICYVVAKLELGSRRHFQLIGYYSVPFGLSVLAEAVMRTEMYEYVLWLTSGQAQPSFQLFKLCQATRLANDDLDLSNFSADVFEYCEVITRAVIDFPDRVTRSFIEWLLLLSCKLQKDNTEEPEWLLELRQLHRTKLANANVSDDPEQHMASTSHDVVSEIQQLEGCLLNEPIPELQPPEQLAELEAALRLRYIRGKLLGKGGFGEVYAGTRIADGKKVAIKVVDKDTIFNNTIIIPGETEELPAEVALMVIVSKPPVCSNIVELLEWFDMGNRIVMIMERPSPCMDLCDFIFRNRCCVSEAQARYIMAQVIRAARHCCDRGVLHRDIKAENIIINPDTLEVKLIDFGCGELLKDTPYTNFTGTDYFIPLEWLVTGKYMGVPATIWGLGIFLFQLLNGEFPFNTDFDYAMGYLELSPDLSQECLQLLMWCLDFNPETRPTFEHLARHDWFTGGSSGQSPDAS